MADFLAAVGGFFDAFPVWIVAITTLVTGASAITALTPSRADDRWIQWILDVLNFLSVNFGRNKNADDDRL